MNPREVSKQLRLVQEKHKNDFTPTGSLCISDMAGDAANAIDSLISSAQFKSPGQEFLEKKFNIPICHELSQTYEELYQLAYHDPLTGCYNRNMLEKLRSKFDPKRCAVAIVDIDNFKKYNTDYGHIGGDKRLREIADLLKANYENVFRIGGDEFMVVTDAIEFITVRDILNSIGGISAGVYNKHTSEDLSSAMHKADILMYVIKNKKELNSVYEKI